MQKDTYILGISCFYHDSAAALIKNGELIAAAQEERFTRKKHDDNVPLKAIDFCLKKAGIGINDLQYVVFYDKPLVKFERIIQTYLKSWPFGFKSYMMAIPLWIKKKLWMKHILRQELDYEGEILFTEHHIAHAASAFLVSPFEDAAVVTLDGVGEWDTTTIGYGQGSDLKLHKTIEFPHSLGLLYSAFTYYLGFKVNSAEYKVMGLAPYGNPDVYYDKVKELIDVKNDGSFQLKMKYFGYEHDLKMTTKHFDKLFGGPARKPESELTQREKDIAAALQKVLNEIVLKIVDYAYEQHPSDNLCMAGGVALNCVANGEIIKHSKFKNLFIQPAAGDAGGALGAAYYVWNTVLGNPRNFVMEHTYYGSEYSDEEIEQALMEKDLEFIKHEGDDIIETTAKLIEGENVIGWFQGRMEFGPRSLGSRSIIADSRNKENWQKVNLKIKFRESFRPFAPTVLEDKCEEHFDIPCPSPFMLLVAPVKSDNIPAVTHVDQSARIQTVNRDQNPKYYDLIQNFYELSGCPVIINTSFNVRGEPIVESPENAINCFLNTYMDYLVIGNYVVSKEKNKHLVDEEKLQNYLDQFELD